ncbi:hypothetical protein EW026_g4686 [Hermanssonia centrifuga]|uniref:Eukaryotic translation initiation factor 3 subunit L n=1 Tax=Hermanssonia centrifuga TaxID=98765 RepID=A0A4V3XA97_9APHY|nr:hypothetical protein EW026_g4686 [Hermanssonia centrifuga]
MAQQRKALWEADLDEELHDVDLNIAIGNYGQNGLYDDAQPRIDEPTLLAVQHQVAQQAALAQIPDAVKRFIVHFHQAVLDNNLSEITVAYESGWNRLTEKFYAKTEWPEAEIIAPLVNDDQIFLILYRELYYRHVYSRIQPDIDDRFHSYENSCELFNYLLNSDGPVPLELPEQWLWDIIDEFIYQFQSFCVWRSKVKPKTDEELMLLADAGQAWSSYSVLNVLYSLIQKSKINEHLTALQEGKSADEIVEIVGEYGTKPLYRMLGYFSLIGLLRVHSLLGDFTLALKVMESVELNQKINKTADRMYALFAVCNALSPSRVDDNISNTMKEKYGEQFTKMSRGEEGIPAFEELFLYACPKFISANPPPYEDAELLQAHIEELPVEPAQRHLSLFLSDVRAQAPVPTLRSFLKLYTSLDAKKLSNFLDADEEEMVQQLMVMKQASRSISRVENEKGLLGGQMISTSDLDFVIDENMVHIAESTVGRRYAGWFIRNTEHAQRVYDTVHNSPLPIPPKSASQVKADAAAAPPSAAPVSQRTGQRVAWGGNVKAA